ncbi:MAG: gliding motility-associated C-terminal domain-containing protein [Bacteroidetes bacterium]|nr:gliding motility-associated C-terminal domain-containing protein [Bacteroidota bacterium]
MKKGLHFLSLFSFFLIFLFSPRTTRAQASACPAVDAGPDQSICSGQCVNLNASVQGSVGTTSYTVNPIAYNPYPYTGGNSVLINIDDTWSGTIALPFCFEFFGNTYNSIVIGSNAIITFDLTQASGYCQWPIGAAIPSNADPMNSIMCPWHDIDPSVATANSATDVNWQVYGSAPCREFVVSWNDVAMYQCNNLIATSEVVLHETTNIIDVYCQDKPVCTTWNGGAAIEGIQNATGTNAFFVPGRNYPTQWTATNDGQRFMPAGAPNYSVSWTGPSGVIGTTNTVNVCPTATTTYTATVTNTSCSGPIVVNDQITINVSNSLTATTSTTASSCASNTGSATVVPSGGSGTYTYNWTPSGGTNATAINLASGNYTCVITDANTGCATTVTLTVPNTGNLTATSSSASPTCTGGNNGNASVTASGGSGVYTYSWAPSGGNGATATNLSSGTYTCTITDSNGCTNLQVVNVTQPPPITATSTQTNVLCNGGNNGSTTISPFGGTPSYNYSWAPTGGTNATASGLTAGTYTCMITDANGCSGTATVTITEPNILAATITVVNAGCSSNGSATANPSGGTMPYSYSWSSGGNAQTENNLVQGTYTCTITDANGCTTTQTCSVTNPTGVTATSTFTDVQCFGNNNGSASVTASGGTGIYSYSWAPFGGNAATASGLPGGSYTCTITDSNGCSTVQIVTISEPAQLITSTSAVPVSCFGWSDGSGTLNVSGGTPAYTFNWAPSGGTGQTANSLPAGNYTVTVTDANGCISTQPLSITQPTQIAVNTSGNSVCYGVNSVITSGASGGTGPYFYTWSPGGQTTQNINVNLISTTSYTVTVTDLNGCTATGTVTATVNPLPLATISSNATNGVFQLTGSSGQLCFTGNSGVVSWNWLLGTSDTSSSQNPCITITSGNIGSYCAQLIVENSFGCTDTTNTCIEITNSSYSIPNVFTPNGDGNNDLFVITNTGMQSLQCSIYNRWGELIYQWNSTSGGWDGKTKNGSPASDGVYYFTARLTDYSEKVYDESGFIHLIKDN